MADFYSKYSGEQVETLLDIVNQGGGGGGVVVKEDTYTANFTIQQLRMYAGTELFSLSIPIDFIDAVIAGKIILIPYEFGLVGLSGSYAIILSASAYKNDTNIGCTATIYTDNEKISFSADAPIDSNSVTLSGANINIEAIPDRASVEEIEQAIEDLPTIRDNAAKGATALQYYVTIFDIADLNKGEDLFQEQVDKANLVAAILANKLILMPRDKTIPESGFIVLACYVEDLLYIDGAIGNQVFHVETIVNNPDIYTSEITISAFATQDDVGNAISEAITNVINASY